MYKCRLNHLSCGFIGRAMKDYMEQVLIKEVLVSLLMADRGLDLGEADGLYCATWIPLCVAGKHLCETPNSPIPMNSTTSA